MRNDSQTRRMLEAFMVGFSAALGAASVAVPSSAWCMEPDEIFLQISGAVMAVQAYDANNIVVGTGSAVLVQPERLLTTCHVLARASRIEIRQDEAAYGADLLHIDLERDLCEIRAKHLHAKPVQIGDSDTVRVGKKVYTLGAPGGIELTFADGMVSGLRKDKEGRLRYIQTSAPISAGSSGGGLFDTEGTLIGITAMYRNNSQNLNFAIPINMHQELPARSAAAMAATKHSTTFKGQEK